MILLNSLLKATKSRLFPTKQTVSNKILLDSLQDAVLVLDQQGNIKYVNHCWKKITGVEAKKSFDEHIERFLHPEDITVWSRSFQTLHETKQQLIWCRLLNASGEVHWCEIRMQMMTTTPSHQISATLCDITSQVRSDNIRQADHRSLTAMVNRLPAIIYRARNNKNWSMEYVSDGCLALTGYPAEQLVNHTQLSFASLIHPNDSTYVWEKVQIALQKKCVFNLQYRLIHASGNILHVSEKGQGIYADTGAILGVEGIIFKQETAISPVKPLYDVTDETKAKEKRISNQ